MADVELNGAVESIRGKLAKQQDIYYRTRNGKQFAVQLVNPRSKFTTKEKGLHVGFGQLSKLASQIAKKPELAAPFMPDFEAQKAKPNGQPSLYQYLLTRFLREAKSDRAGKVEQLSTLCRSISDPKA